jgi:hypothetical protein
MRLMTALVLVTGIVCAACGPSPTAVGEMLQTASPETSPEIVDRLGGTEEHVERFRVGDGDAELEVKWSTAVDPTTGGRYILSTETTVAANDGLALEMSPPLFFGPTARLVRAPAPDQPGEAIPGGGVQVVTVRGTFRRRSGLSEEGGDFTFLLCGTGRFRNTSGEARNQVDEICGE